VVSSLGEISKRPSAAAPSDARAASRARRVAVDGGRVHENEAATREFVPLVEFRPAGLTFGDDATAAAVPDRRK
jgi:hypothetical protein